MLIVWNIYNYIPVHGFWCGQWRMCTPCLVISGLLFHCQQWSLENYTEKKMTFSDAEIHNLYYYKNVTYFSFLSEGERERIREKERIIANQEKAHTKCLCKEIWHWLLYTRKFSSPFYFHIFRPHIQRVNLKLGEIHISNYFSKDNEFKTVPNCLQVQRGEKKTGRNNHLYSNS